jgi:hypothetical protein
MEIHEKQYLKTSILKSKIIAMSPQQSTNMDMCYKSMQCKKNWASKRASLSQGILNAFKSHEMELKAKRDYFHLIIVGF